MSSQTRDERGDANRLDLRTLAIASVSSAVAALVVSRIWASGTPIAAAATPVIVTILREMLDRPTAKIAEKVTVPAAARVGRDAASEDAPAVAGGQGEIRVYRQQPTGRIASRIKPKVVAVTAALAFVIAGVVLTAGQLAIGNPFGDDGDGAIILGQGKGSGARDDARQNTTTAPQQSPPEADGQTTPQPAPAPEQTAPVEPEDEPAPEQTTPQAQPRNLQGPKPTTPQP